jgi:hypothetical protein
VCRGRKTLMQNPFSWQARFDPEQPDTDGSFWGALDWSFDVRSWA